MSLPKGASGSQKHKASTLSGGGPSRGGAGSQNLMLNQSAANNMSISNQKANDSMAKRKSSYTPSNLNQKNLTVGTGPSTMATHLQRQSSQTD